MLIVATLVTAAYATTGQRHLRVTTGGSTPNRSGCPSGEGVVRVRGTVHTAGHAVRAYFAYGRTDHPNHTTRAQRVARGRTQHVSACIVGISFQDPLLYRIEARDGGTIVRGRVREESGHGRDGGPPIVP